jgi:hypothetical protein
MQSQPTTSCIRQLVSDLEITCRSQVRNPLERFKHMMDLFDQEQSSLNEQARNHDTLPVIKQSFPPLFSL